MTLDKLIVLPLCPQYVEGNTELPYRATKLPDRATVGIPERERRCVGLNFCKATQQMMKKSVCHHLALSISDRNMDELPQIGLSYWLAS